MKKGSPKGEPDKAQKTRLVTLAACATTGAPKERGGYAVKRSYAAKEGADMLPP